eukprot:gene4528-14692_t
MLALSDAPGFVTEFVKNLTAFEAFADAEFVKNFTSFEAFADAEVSKLEACLDEREELPAPHWEGSNVTAMREMMEMRVFLKRWLAFFPKNQFLVLHTSQLQLNPVQTKPEFLPLLSVFLKRWLAFFPKDQFLVLYTSQLETNPLVVMRKVEDFLGISAHTYDSATLRTKFNNKDLHGWASMGPHLRLRHPPHEVQQQGPLRMGVHGQRIQAHTYDSATLSTKFNSKDLYGWASMGNASKSPAGASSLPTGLVRYGPRTELESSSGRPLIYKSALVPKREDELRGAVPNTRLVQFFQPFMAEFEAMTRAGVITPPEADFFRPYLGPETEAEAEGELLRSVPRSAQHTRLVPKRGDELRGAVPNTRLVEPHLLEQSAMTALLFVDRLCSWFLSVFGNTELTTSSTVTFSAIAMAISPHNVTSV